VLGNPIPLYIHEYRNGGGKMSKRILISILGVVLIAGFALAGDKDKSGSWTGIITDSHCGYNAKHSADCVNKCVKDHDAKYALVNEADKKVYILNPQEGAAAHANEKVTVSGTVDGDTIKVTKIEAAK
jgi:hypothetical protein